MDAAVQMFFTLGVGSGALIAFASYMPQKNNCIRDAYTVVFVNCGTSLFAGIVVFSILGYREKKTGIPVTKVRYIEIQWNLHIYIYIYKPVSYTIRPFLFQWC